MGSDCGVPVRWLLGTGTGKRGGNEPRVWGRMGREWAGTAGARPEAVSCSVSVCEGPTGAKAGARCVSMLCAGNTTCKLQGPAGNHVLQAQSGCARPPLVLCLQAPAKSPQKSLACMRVTTARSRVSRARRTWWIRKLRWGLGVFVWNWNWKPWYS